jgi:putative tryptophan/tyrosine transport system substrate-binding protein
MRFDQLKRREFITLLGGAAAAWPVAARAQQAAKLPTIGFLGTPAASAWAPWTAAFVQRLRELGWIEGRTVAIQYRWAEGRAERWAEFAVEFVGLNVDVIVSGGNAAVAAKRASTVVPIVFTMVDDPVGMGLVTSLARPGGNVTGLAMQSTDVVGKRLALLREAVPDLRRLAIMANVEYPFAALEMAQAQTAVRTLGLDAAIFEIRRAEDIAPAFEALKDRADALYVVGDALVMTHRIRINTLALTARVPTMHVVRELVEVGGLMSYGANFSDLFRRAADYVDKILRGGKPGDIPVEQPTKFDLVINLTTARALGLTVPPTLLARADEVIE